LLELSHLLDELRHPSQRCPRPQKLHARARRVTEGRFTSGEISDDASPRGDSSSVPDGQVIANGRLPSRHHASANAGRATYRGLRGHDRVSTHHDIMPEVDEVVELDANVHSGLPNRATIDGSIGPDLDIILDGTRADLWDLLLRPFVERVAESVGTNPNTCMEDNSSAHLGSRVYHDMWMQRRLRADLGSIAYYTMGSNTTAVPDAGA